MSGQLEGQLQLLAVAIVRVRQVNESSTPIVCYPPQRIDFEYITQTNEKVAALTVLALDWLLTLNLEVSLVWNARWNVVKVLYLITRYLPFALVSFIMYHQFGYAIPENTCKITYDLGSWFFIVSTCVSDSILTIRTWAVWGKGKQLTYVLLGAFSLVWLSIFALAGVYVKATRHEISPVPQLIGCLLDSAGIYLVPGFAGFAVHDMGMLLLMLSKGISTFRLGGGFRFSTIIYRDGIIYYVYLFGLSLLNIIIIAALPRDYYVLLVVFEGVVHSVLACRVVLHIREQAHIQERMRSQWDDPTGNSLPLSPLRFQETQGVI